MNGLLNLLLGLSSAITLLLVYLTLFVKAPTGPDRAGIGALWFLLTAPRWIAMLVVLWTLLGRGAFDWIAESRQWQMAVVLGSHAVMGFIVLMAVAAANGMGSSDPEWERWGATALSIGVPVIVIVYAALAVHPDWNPGVPPVVLRGLLGGAAAVCVVIAAVGGVTLTMQSMERQAAEDRAKALEQDKEYQSRLKEFQALPADAPLLQWLRFLHNEPGDIGEQARRAISARPNLIADLSTMLRNEENQEALAYIRTEMRTPPGELAPAASDGIRRLAEWLKVKVGYGVSYDDEYGFECRLATEVAERFGKESAVFVEPMQMMLRAVEGAKDPRTASQGRHEVKGWLKRHGH